MRRCFRETLVLFIILMALPACAALPYDGSVLRELSTRIHRMTCGHDQSSVGAACRCEAVCQ